VTTISHSSPAVRDRTCPGSHGQELSSLSSAGEGVADVYGGVVGVRVVVLADHRSDGFEVELQVGLGHDRLDGAGSELRSFVHASFTP
jgi:hypothetical protein